MKIEVNKFNTILLIIFFCLFENVFFIVNSEENLLIGQYNNIILLLFIVVFSLISFKIKENKIKSSFSKFVITLIILTFISSFTAYKYVNQPILEGLLQQRTFIIILFSYFPLRNIILNERIDLKLLKKGIVFLGLSTILIALLQVLLHDKITFLNVYENVDSIRTVRLYLDSFLCVAIAFIGMNDYLNTFHKSSLILVLLSYIYEIFISKGRLEFVALTGALIIGYLLKKRKKGHKFYAFLFVIILGALFLQSSYADRFYSALRNINSENGKINTMAVRNGARKLFQKQLMETPLTLLFGCGYPSSNWAPSRAKIRKDLYYGLVDNGIFSFIYVYGILGLLIILLLYLKLIKLSIKVFKEKKKYSFIMYVIFLGLLCYNIVFWWYKQSWALSLVILMILLEKNTLDKDKKIEEKIKL